MELGDAKYTVNVKDEATAKMKRIEGSMDSMGKKFTKVGAAMMLAGVAIGGGIFKLTDSYTKAGDEVAKMAKRTGFSTESLSELRHAAKLSGSDIGTLEKGVKRMSSAIEDAKDGLETYTRSFDKLGLSIDDIAAMTPEEQFWAIANALADLDDATMKAALAQDFFGRAGTDLLPMLAEGTEGIAAMRQEAHDLGIVFNEEAAAECENFQDALTNLKESLAGLGREIVDDLTPIMIGWIEKITETIKRIKDWTEAHPGLAENLLKLAGILAVGGAIMMALGSLARAIVAINVALAIMHGLAGPAGWAKMAAGLILAAGVIYGMHKLTTWEPGMPEVAMPGVPVMQAGGIVPGPFGKPVPILAHGGELVSGLHGKAIGGTTINISMGNYLGDEASLREFARAMGDILGQDVRRTSFSGVNTLEYFPGSSAP